jgi:hypothetical protein
METRSEHICSIQYSDFCNRQMGKKIIKIQCGNYIPFTNGWESAFENKLFGESSAYPK